MLGVLDVDPPRVSFASRASTVFSCSVSAFRAKSNLLDDREPRASTPYRLTPSTPPPHREADLIAVVKHTKRTSNSRVPQSAATAQSQTQHARKKRRTSEIRGSTDANSSMDLHPLGRAVKYATYRDAVSAEDLLETGLGLKELHGVSKGRCMIRSLCRTYRSPISRAQENRRSADWRSAPARPRTTSLARRSARCSTRMARTSVNRT